MGKIIDGKKLIDTIEKNCYFMRYGRYGGSMEKGMTVTGIRQAIDEQPEALDIGVIMEKLREKAMEDGYPDACISINDVEDVLKSVLSGEGKAPLGEEEYSLIQEQDEMER